MTITPRRGLRFEHARWRKSVAGLRFEDCPPVVCQVTAVRQGTAYYRQVDETGTGNPWFCSVADFPAKVGRLLDDVPAALPPVKLTMLGSSGAWRGALKAGSKVLVECGHSHANRYSGYTGSARQCMQTLIHAARDEQMVRYVVGAAVASAGHARRLGARITDEEAAAKATATVDAIRAVVESRDFHLPTPPGMAARGFTCGCCRPTGGTS